MREIQPGQHLLIAALPMPMDGLQLLHRVVERIYGTGESMLSFSTGDSDSVLAPADGFGPLKSTPFQNRVAKWTDLCATS